MNNPGFIKTLILSVELVFQYVLICYLQLARQAVFLELILYPEGKDIVLQVIFECSK